MPIKVNIMPIKVLPATKIKSIDIESLLDSQFLVQSVHGIVSVIKPQIIPSKDGRSVEHIIFDTLTEGIAERLHIENKELTIEFKNNMLYVYHDDTILREWNGDHPYMECFFETIEGYGIYFYIPRGVRDILKPLMNGSNPHYFDKVMEYYYTR